MKLFGIEIRFRYNEFHEEQICTLRELHKDENELKEKLNGLVYQWKEEQKKMEKQYRRALTINMKSVKGKILDFYVS